MRILRLLSAMLVGVALVGCEPIAEPIPDELQPTFMKGAPVMASVSGSAHHTWRHPVDGREGWLTFSFTARKNADGLVDGRYQMRNRGAPNWSRGVITCFGTDGEQAWLEIVVEEASQPRFLGERAFWVEDMGEGQGADPDRISRIRRRSTFYPGYENPGDFCDAQPEIDESYIFSVEAGNISVKN